jgi:hypothetical protein
MAIDVGRVIQAALEAATQAPSSDGEAKKPGHTCPVHERYCSVQDS